jgi:hypothetical protein
MTTSSADCGRRRDVDRSMSARWLGFALLALLLSAAGCNTDQAGRVSSVRAALGEDPDAAVSGSDAAPAMGAAGSLAIGGANSAADGGGPAIDPSLDPSDAAMPTQADAAPPELDDAAMPTQADAALPELDAAVPTQTDAALPELDAAMPAQTDAAPPELDAAMPMEPEDDAGMDMGMDAASGDPADEHCAMDMPADPRDAMLTSSAPVAWTNGRARDVLLPQSVIDWLDERELSAAHDAWHATRRWDDLCDASTAPAEGCDFAQSLIAENLWRAEYQQGGPGAGLAFLHMHRHMIHMFRSAFPTHADLFDGWTHVPRSIDDPENPTPWKTVTWSSDNLIGFDILENIEEHLDEFANEDELGVFIESTFRWTPEAPVVSLGMPGSGVHGAMHNQWAVGSSPANLGRTDTALANYIFWKLHGFIDDVWSRYRLAKHLHDEDIEYKTVARYECRLMYYLAPSHRPEPPPPTDTGLKRGN